MKMEDVLLSFGDKHEKGFESLAPQAIARAVLENLERKEAVTVDDVIATMQGWLDNPKANEPVRVAVNAGIRHLEDLRERRRST
ncbi:MAG: hypothetical protein HQL36_02860 [Alphaproteobacteria bacterium]|nr:hypothetical protein [Alphaproteobacteria bacterium]MBF0251147.1 hypothetical protein [Alphaproteobacteria bacterium]